MKIETVSSSRKAKILIHGHPNAGKTRVLGTANLDDRTSPILLLDYEGGTSSLVGIVPKVDRVRIRGWDEFNEAYEFLANDKHEYKSVGIDSLSETHVQSLILRLDDTNRRRATPYSLDEGDYGVALMQLRLLIRSFRDLDMHVFCTALSVEARDPKIGNILRPAFAGQLAHEVPGMFEVVGYLGIFEEEIRVGKEVQKKDVRSLILGGYPKIRTKYRIPADMPPLPDEIPDPTITALLDVLGIPHDPEV